MFDKLSDSRSGLPDLSESCLFIAKNLVWWRFCTMINVSLRRKKISTATALVSMSAAFPMVVPSLSW